MLIESLLEKARERLDDPLPEAAYQIVGEDADIDCRWKTQELLGYLTEAEREACYRARLVIDSTTAETCVLDIEAGVNAYTLDSRILAVIRLALPGIAYPLDRVSLDELDRSRRNWMSEEGVPAQYCLDVETGKLYLDRVPLVDYTGSSMTVHRLPLERLALAVAPDPEVPEDEGTPAVELEIPENYHMDLLHWVERLAFLKRDAETFDKKRSDDAETRFGMVFGSRPSAPDLSRLLRSSRRRSRAYFF